MLERFMEALSCIDQCFIGDEMLGCPSAPSRVGKSMVGGIDLNKPRSRPRRRGGHHSVSLTRRLHRLRTGRSGPRAGNQSPSAYGPRKAAYDLKKLRGKQIVRRIGSTRRCEPLPPGLRAITALLALRG